MSYESCPACSCKKYRVVRCQIRECTGCGALYGECYLGESYGFVKPFFAPAEVPFEQTRYFDFTCLGSAGVTRRHGWYDTASKLITQVG